MFVVTRRSGIMSPYPRRHLTQWQERLRERLRKEGKNSRDGSDNWSTILRVPHRLREVNDNAYTPKLISIGPYHHGLPHLEEMEEYKKQCLSRIIDRKGQKLVDRCLQAMNIEQVRKFYSQSSLKLHEKALGKMILLDGCFVVQLLCGREQYFHPIFSLKWIQTALLNDFLLLENQLPFSVLVNLYQMTEDAPTDGRDFAFQAFSVLSQLLPGPMNWNTIANFRPAISDPSKIKHLLSLVHDNWSPSPRGMRRHKLYYKNKGEILEKKRQRDEESGMITKRDRSFSKYWKHIFCAIAGDKEDVRKGLAEWQSIRCATELEEAGIRFVNVGVDSDSDVESLFDISFKGSTLKIPTLVVGDNTEDLFRNLIAYELYNEGSTYVIDYVTLMDNLINSANDVRLLRFSGVIENMLGDDEAVAQMINKLHERVTLCGDTFFYEEIFVGLKQHCARSWNIYKAKLRHDYFNGPWAHISFLAALLITVATIGQFVTALIPLVNK